MDIRAIEKHYDVEVKSGQVLIKRLNSQIKAFEKKYNITSEEMLVRVKQNPILETEEIGIWLQDYTVLKRILNGTGMVGTHTKITSGCMTTV